MEFVLLSETDVYGILSFVQNVALKLEKRTSYIAIDSDV